MSSQPTLIDNLAQDKRFKIFEIPLGVALNQEIHRLRGFGIALVDVYDTASTARDHEHEILIQFNDNNDISNPPLRMTLGDALKLKRGFQDVWITSAVNAITTMRAVIVIPLQDPESIEYFTNKSSGVNLIGTVTSVTNILNLENLENINFNGPINLDSLGDNGQIVTGSGFTIRTTTGASTATIYTVPVGKKAYILYTTCSVHVQNAPDYNYLFRSKLSGGLTTRSLYGGDGNVPAANTNAETVVTTPPVYKQDFLSAGDSIDVTMTCGLTPVYASIVGAAQLFECDA